MPNPVVAFFDVDGTLTYRDPVTGPTDVPTPRVADAIRRFVEAGNVSAVCTGRRLPCVCVVVRKWYWHVLMKRPKNCMTSTQTIPLVSLVMLVFL